MYRLYLAGGPDSLRLPRASAFLVVTVALAAQFSVLPAHTQRTDWLSMPLAAAGALGVALFATRWLGSRRGLLAGIVTASSLWAFGCPGPAGSDRLAAVVAWAALAAFAAANVPGRLAFDGRRRTVAAFWIALAATSATSGNVGACYVLMTLGLYLLALQDRKGLRFLLNPWGLAVIALVSAGREISVRFVPDLAVSAAPAGTTSLSPLVLAGWLLVAALPWVPLALPAAVRGLGAGYWLAPFWRLLLCWTAAPALLWATGLFRHTPHLAILLPPLAILSATGLDDVLGWIRRHAAIKPLSGQATP